MECSAKHTKAQVPDANFKCPKCGTRPDSRDYQFVIQEPAEGSGDCPLLHDLDEVGCDKCGYGATGKRFAAEYSKRHGLVKCQHCNGSGMVQGPAKKLEAR